jgi:primosomal protein N' (replication factor Y)
MPKFVRVSINIAQISDVFDYSIPEEYEGSIQPGSLVIVPFGRQTVQAIVLSFIDTPSVSEIKPIQFLADRDPVVTLHQIELAGKMAETNFTTLAENLDLMVPPGLSQHADVLIHPIHQNNPPEDLSPLQLRVLKFLAARGPLRGHQLDASLPKTDWRASLPGLIKRGLAVSEPVLNPPSVHPRLLRNANLLLNLEDSLSRLTEKNARTQSAVMLRRRNVIEVLAREGEPTDVSMLYAETGANSTDLKWLAEQGIITFGESEVWRDPLANLSPVLQHAPQLTPDQEVVWQAIEPQISEKTEAQVNLLIGVTGSGKTEIYLHAVKPL